MQVSAAGDFGGGGGVYRARVSKRVDGSRGSLARGTKPVSALRAENLRRRSGRDVPVYDAVCLHH